MWPPKRPAEQDVENAEAMTMAWGRQPAVVSPLETSPSAMVSPYMPLARPLDVECGYRSNCEAWGTPTRRIISPGGSTISDGGPHQPLTRPQDLDCVTATAATRGAGYASIPESSPAWPLARPVGPLPPHLRLRVQLARSRPQTPSAPLWGGFPSKWPTRKGRMTGLS